MSLEEVTGFLEEITPNSVKGWIYDRNSPNTSLDLVITDNGKHVGAGAANIYREDLSVAGIGNGKHGFLIQTPDLLDFSKLEFRVNGREVKLNTVWPTIKSPDEYLLRSSPSPYSPINTDQANHLLWLCLKEPSGLSLFRLIGLMDAFSSISSSNSIKSVLSIGCGEGLHERYLAALFPSLQVLATDLELRASPAGTANITFQSQDILTWSDFENYYDFAFSIECLEHIPSFDIAFENICSKVKPGGFIYHSVPFANEAERADPHLKKEEFALHGHVTPGFSEELLRELCSKSNLEIIFIESMFNQSILSPFNNIVKTLGDENINSVFRDLLLLAQADLVRELKPSRNTAFGVRLLARKRL